jgi:hypothetical protein
LQAKNGHARRSSKRSNVRSSFIDLFLYT